MKDQNPQKIFEALTNISEDILSEALETDNNRKLQALGGKETKKIIIMHPIFRRIVAACLCLVIVLVSVVVSTQHKPQETPIVNEDGSEIKEVQPDKPNDKFEIDSLDKLNFYSVKKAISEIDFAPLSNSGQQAKVVNLTESNKFKNINADTPFTITMYSYFKINLENSRGFLASKLGGTGLVDVVITKNDFENMITFKKGDKYFSCLQDSATENSMSFSTYKYIDGFKLVENYGRENYEFTISFDGDRVTGIETDIFNSNIGFYEYTSDRIKFVDNYSVVVYQTKTVTIAELEKMFSGENSDLSNAAVSGSEPVVLGEAALTNKTVSLAENQKDVILRNEDILRVAGKYDDVNGYYLELKLTENGRTILKKSIEDYNFISIYVNNFLVTDIFAVTTVVNDTAIFTNFSSKDKMLEAYNELTQRDSKNQIGRIVDNSSFLYEMPKLINLDNYDFTMGWTSYVYTHKTAKKLEYKPSNYEITVDGVKLTMPICVSELIAKGFEPIWWTDYDIIGDFKNQKGNEFSVYCMDFKRDAKDQYDYFVTQIDFHTDAFSGKRGTPNPTLPEFTVFEDINKDITMEKLINKLGEPHKIVQQASSQNVELQTRMSLLSFYYYFPTKEIPNGYLIVNFEGSTKGNPINNYASMVGMSIH